MSERARRPFPPGYWTIWTTVALDLIGFGIVAPILPLYAKRFGATGFVGGLLFSTFSLAQLVCAPLLGRLSDRIGRKPVIIISLFGTAVGSFLTAAAGGLPLLFIGRLLDGASGASVAVAQGAVTDLASPEDRPRLLGLLGAAFGVGFVIGPAIGGLARFHASLPFVIAGVLATINGVAAIVRLPETRHHIDAAAAHAHHAASFLAARSRSLITLLVVSFAATCAFSGFEGTFSRFGNARFGLTLGSAAMVFVGIGLFLVLVQGGMVGPVTHRMGAPRAYRIGLAFSGVGLALLAGSRSWWALVPSLAFLALGHGLATPTMTSMVVDRVPPHQKGQALGFQQSVGSLARIVGPAAAGKLFDVQVGLPYVAGAILTFLALALLLIERSPSFSAATAAD